MLPAGSLRVQALGVAAPNLSISIVGTARTIITAIIAAPD